MRPTLLVLLAGLTLLAAGCESAPAREPVTQDEIVELSKAGPGAQALTDALESRPLAFPLTWTVLKDLEGRGVPPETLDTVIALATERQALSMASRYGYWWYPYYGPWPYYWHMGAGYHYWR